MIILIHLSRITWITDNHVILKMPKHGRGTESHSVFHSEYVDLLSIFETQRLIIIIKMSHRQSERLTPTMSKLNETLPVVTVGFLATDFLYSIDADNNFHVNKNTNPSLLNVNPPQICL